MALFLPDHILAEILKRLPLTDRLRASEVCQSWRAVSRLAWLTTFSLEFNRLPKRHASAIVRLCANLSSASSIRQAFHLSDLHTLTQESVKTLRFSESSFSVDTTSQQSETRALTGASWTELVWHDTRLIDKFDPQRQVAVPDETLLWLPDTLKRLQWSSSSENTISVTSTLQRNLTSLHELESLILLQGQYLSLNAPAGNLESQNIDVLSSLTNLKELCIDDCVTSSALLRGVMALPRLEVLFVRNIPFEDDDLLQLTTKHRTLRILVITGCCRNEGNWVVGLPFANRQSRLRIPPRANFAQGSVTERLPVLHVILGKTASQSLIFINPNGGTTKLYRINGPLPLFLEREEMQYLLKGVWTVERIQKGAKLWNY